MQVYIVTRDEVPCMTTLDEREVRAAFEQIVRSGRYRQAAALALPARDEGSTVIMEAYQGA